MKDKSGETKLEIISKDLEMETKVITLGLNEMVVSAKFEVGNWGPTRIVLLLYYDIFGALVTEDPSKKRKVPKETITIEKPSLSVTDTESASV